MACEECADLTSHEFRSADDLLHAVRVAGAEMERGVLQRVDMATLRDSEQDALRSAFTAGELPQAIDYRFRCTVCGDRFRLEADLRDGSGRWSREEGSR